ncbi:hypothetical protein [Streptomyces sp. NPDC001135]
MARPPLLGVQPPFQRRGTWAAGRRLVAVADEPPAADGPDGTADPRPLRARAEQTRAGYRTAAEEPAAGALAREDFADRTGPESRSSSTGSPCGCSPPNP